MSRHGQFPEYRSPTWSSRSSAVWVIPRLVTTISVSCSRAASSISCGRGLDVQQGSPRLGPGHMALAVTRLAEQLAPADSEDIHTALVGKNLCPTIRHDAERVNTTVSTARISDTGE